MHYITTLSITTVSYGILNPWNINARFTSTYNSLSHTTVSTEYQELDMYNHITCMTQKYMYYKNILCTFFSFYRIFNRYRMLSPGYVPSDMKDGRTNSFKIPLPDIEKMTELKVCCVRCVWYEQMTELKVCCVRCIWYENNDWTKGMLCKVYLIWKQWLN